MYTSDWTKINDQSVSRNFSVEISPTLNITKPEDSTVNGNQIKFEWEHFLPSPYTFESYTYTIKKDDTNLQGYTNKTITNENNTSITLSDNLTIDSTYELELSMNYKSWNDTKNISATPKTVTLEWTTAWINISSPIDGTTYWTNTESQNKISINILLQIQTIIK